MSDKPRPPIVVVAYNRPRSLDRLLSSIADASYPENTSLIISIDKAPENDDVIKIARDFNWSFGEKTIKIHESNLGLRRHVLFCASYAEYFGSVVVLEDDLYVSPSFYYYAQEALEFSLKKKYIAGISLYSHCFNVHSRTNFAALDDGYDNWYFQFASSWGQAWTWNQLQEFLGWYEDIGSIEPNSLMPQNVTSWSDRSWLKYYIAFLVEKNKYFLYPKKALSTNFSDKGAHIERDSTTYQVDLFLGKKRHYLFSELSASRSVYDAFFENQGLNSILGLDKKELTVDLYATKPLGETRYLLSSQTIGL